MFFNKNTLCFLSAPLLFLVVWFMPDTTWHSILLTQLPWLGVVALAFWKNRTEAVFKGVALWSALCGLVYAVYLYGSLLQGEVAQCGAGGCQIAQSSSYATLFWGLPTSLVGVAGYFLVLLSLLLPGNVSRVTGAFLATFGLGVSLFLTFSSVHVLGTTCQWCLGSAAAMTSLFVIFWWRMWIYYNPK